jgi:hypothetical protein
MRLACGCTNDTKHTYFFELITANRFHDARSMTTWAKGQCNVYYDTKNISMFFAFLFGFRDNYCRKKSQSIAGLALLV